METFLEAVYNIATAENAKPILAGAFVIGAGILITMLIAGAIRRV